MVKSKRIVVDEFGNAIENAYLVNTNSDSHAHTDELGNSRSTARQVGNVLNTMLGV
jgi:hypothetical protein